MTVKNCYDSSKRQWDRFKAFHHTANNTNIVIFDTGELIFCAAQTNAGYRREYPEIGIRLDTTANLSGSLYDSAGREIKRAWFPYTQHLLIDYSTNRVVSTEGARYKRYNNERVVRQGVPERFQKLAQVYIGGEGQLPVPTSKITTQLPHKMVYNDEQIAHFEMLTSTFRAVAKLDSDINIGKNYGTTGMSPDLALKCQTWQDVPTSLYNSMFHAGVARPTTEFDYLLTEPS